MQAELERAVALLMDPDGLGLDDQTARRWAKGVPFALVRAHVFRLLEERKKRPNIGIAVLRTRLQKRWTASVSDASKSHPLWNRYAVGDELWEAPEENSEAARRAKYIPDEFSDIILG